ncbi:MAG TPA: gluconate 2-dehydrogenase subunit 3 family protein [Gemmatimonadaceae bacterium]|jgi:hypothetical protein|nr:gluconate 2-dehydrogenase subunit 3 family protein [Gemmatimonadaceae bacterium]
MSSDTHDDHLLNRREAIRRVSFMLGGVAFVGGTNLITACEQAPPPAQRAASPGQFSAEDIAYLDEIAETILPETKTPGAKAAKTGAFMALMVTDSYHPDEQRIFRDGMKQLDDASRKANNASFMASTPQQRLALLTQLDKEQKTLMDAREAAARRRQGLPPVAAAVDSEARKPAEPEKYLPDQRQEKAPGNQAGSGAAAVTADSTITPSEHPHYFRMMKELALLGYFTSEIGYTKAMRYIETPGRFDPCTPYTPGETAWAPHA